jgi:hypothetical protein
MRNHTLLVQRKYLEIRTFPLGADQVGRYADIARTGGVDIKPQSTKEASNG